MEDGADREPDVRAPLDARRLWRGLPEAERIERLHRLRERQRLAVERDLRHLRSTTPGAVIDAGVGTDVAPPRSEAG